MKDMRNYFIVFILIAFVTGALGGMAGVLCVKPFLDKTPWGALFFLNSGNNAPTNVYKVTEDSATIDVVKKVSPGVVSVVVSKELANFYNQTGPDIFGFPTIVQPQQPSAGSGKTEIGGGTGFVVGADGLIITNRHVVADEAADYSVVFNDGKKYDAKVLGRDTINDIAILKIDAKDLIALELGDSDKIDIGQTAIAIGNALSEYKNTVTRGLISGINRRIVAGDGAGSAEVLEEVLQTDAAINPGNSGGPLLNLAGQVIGINTAVNGDGQSIAFAIPINQAKRVIDSVKANGRIVTPWLGVRYIQLTEDTAKQNNLKYNYGALILRGSKQTDFAIVPGSPADKAGLVENDIILEVNGVKLENDKNLAREVLNYKPGDEVTLKIFHKDGEKNVKVKLEERKQ